MALFLFYYFLLNVTINLTIYNLHMIVIHITLHRLFIIIFLFSSHSSFPPSSSSYCSLLRLHHHYHHREWLACLFFGYILGIYYIFCVGWLPSYRNLLQKLHIMVLFIFLFIQTLITYFYGSCYFYLFVKAVFLPVIFFNCVFHIFAYYIITLNWSPMTKQQFIITIYNKCKKSIYLNKLKINIKLKAIN